MIYVEFLALLVVWFVFVALIKAITRFGVELPVEVRHWVLLMVRGRDFVRRILRPIVGFLRGIPPLALTVLFAMPFLTSMFFITPIPLVIYGVDKWYLPSMLMIVMKNLVLMIQAAISGLTPIEAIRMGFVPLIPLVPGVTTTIKTFIYVIIAVCLGILTHEFLHGITALRFNVNVKSGGFFTSFFFLFGGFVEIDEEELKRKDFKTRLAVLTSGVFANLILAYLAVILAVLLPLNPLLLKGLFGVTVVKPIGDVEKGWVIVRVNGEPVASIYTILHAISTIKESHAVKFTLYDPVTGREFVRVVDVEEVYILNYATIYIKDFAVLMNNEFFNFLFWLHTINATLVLLNTLPSYPLDGGRVLELLIERFIHDENTRRKVITSLSAMLWTILAASIGYSLSSGVLMRLLM